MTYYKAVREAHDWFNGYTVAKGELLTSKERNTKARYLGDDDFELVTVNRNNTYKQYDKRFEARGF